MHFPTFAVLAATLTLTSVVANPVDTFAIRDINIPVARDLGYAGIAERQDDGSGEGDAGAATGEETGGDPAAEEGAGTGEGEGETDAEGGKSTPLLISNVTTELTHSPWRCWIFDRFRIR